MIDDVSFKRYPKSVSGFLFSGFSYYELYYGHLLSFQRTRVCKVACIEKLGINILNINIV
jgi:hypothetical protein